MAFTRRGFGTILLKLTGLALLPRKIFAATLASHETRIAFGSCCAQDRAQPIWDTIADKHPNLFAFIGDNIYADTIDPLVMQKKYDQLAANLEFKKFRSRVPLIAMWDDHDYGWNDSGRDYPMKAESKAMFLKFYNEPADSPRRQREGLYTSYFVGEALQRTQIIFMDLRWFRSPLIGTPDTGYTPNFAADATMLGETQWHWLEEQLKAPADFRILASTTQFVSSEHRWEKWANFPLEKARLINMLDRLNVRNLVTISGDMHFAELSMETTPKGFDLYDLTASGMNYVEPANGLLNNKRLAIYDSEPHFGMVRLKWNAGSVDVSLEIYNQSGATTIEKHIKFSTPIA